MIIKRNILLNPGPATTTDTVKLAQIVSDICPREKEFVNVMKDIRQNLVKIVHGDLESYTAVLFCGSGTICMDICLNSLLPKGKKVLIINNGVYSSRAVDICKYYNLDYINLELPFDKPADLSVIELMMKANPEISLVYTTHHETGSGLINPVKEIGKLVHRYNAKFIVDTTSSYAMIPINVKNDNIDFCMASSQKGLMSTTGVSFVIGKRKYIEESKDYPKRSYYCNLYLQYDNFEKTGEMKFTPPVQTVYALKKAIEEYFSEGELEKWNRHKKVWSKLYSGLEKLGFEFVIDKNCQANLVVCVKYPNDPNWNFKKVHDYCYNNGYTIYPGNISGSNTFRLCSLGAIDEHDIDNFFEVFKKSLEINNVSIPLKY